jgi:alkylation response protein AidB-like acyl-CoA dehydrogenase
VDLSLSSTETELGESVRSFVEANVVEAMRSSGADDVGFRPDWQRAMGQAGWLSLDVPARHGGAEASALETAVVFEEFGRGPLPHLPLLHSAAVALVARVGSQEWQRDLLPAMSDGTLVCVPGGLEQLSGGGGAARPTLHLTRSAVGLRLNGVVPGIAFAGSADEIIVLVREEASWSLARVRRSAEGLSTRLLSGFLAWTYEVTFTDVDLQSEDVITVDEAATREALLRPMLWIAAYSLGGCSKALEISRAYCDQRVQFNQPIGRFQRVQDHVIRILNFTDQTRWSLYDAAWRLDSGRPAATSVHLAKAVASEAYWESTNAAHEVLAGIGSDPLFGMASYTRMSRTLFHLLGAPKWHKRQMIQGVLAQHSATGASH